MMRKNAESAGFPATPNGLADVDSDPFNVTG
jgi:hypothetical protein